MVFAILEHQQLWNHCLYTEPEEIDGDTNRECGRLGPGSRQSANIGVEVALQCPKPPPTRWVAQRRTCRDGFLPFRSHPDSQFLEIFGFSRTSSIAQSVLLRF